VIQGHEEDLSNEVNRITKKNKYKGGKGGEKHNNVESIECKF